MFWSVTELKPLVRENFLQCNTLVQRNILCTLTLPEHTSELPTYHDIPALTIMSVGQKIMVLLIWISFTP
ncbi:hypothetical protein L211DRAFT_843019 [Terfezia boudieri ATCC MYA-4762]|uniref:Uncharacterized protein n=1 Tax=Terfezia boudieri ATCC MYA-4762 TaxID=1051890 RepID=A0A3N4L879_9PEZI|nr:hypothetical protein L211DRAFT_843019 [Terfezia boudieri ATCC MYA-4762]